MAAPLYQIASRKETHSEADITSRLRLSLLAGDYHAALEGSLERAQRYDDTQGFRDYLGLLHAMGASDAAWDTFNMLARQMDNPHIWDTVLVGHRKEGKSTTEIAAWAKQQVGQQIGEKSNRTAKYLLRAGIVDRLPSSDWVKALTEVAAQSWKLDKNFGEIVIEIRENGHTEVVSGTGANVQMPVWKGAFSAAKQVPVKSNLVFFAEASLAFREKNFPAAEALLREASTIYNLSRENLAYLLPYFAFAAANSGNVASVEDYIANVPPEERRFDFHLAQAVIQGIGGKTAESLQSLKSALYLRPFTEDRPLPTEYQFAQICLLLHQTTGESQYRDIAIDWAKKNQKFQPWHAWAYAMEAILATNHADRMRAIAIANYLDPNSEMLSQIPQVERERAIKDFDGTKLFLEAGTAVDQEPI